MKPNSVGLESIKEYERTFKSAQSKISPNQINQANDSTKYELFYAEDFLNLFNNKFSSMQITYDDLKQNMKNGIEKRVRDRMAGKGPASFEDTAPRFGGGAQTQIRQPEPMPQPTNTNPFANALSVPYEPDRSGSNMSHNASRSGAGNSFQQPQQSHQQRQPEVIPLPIVVGSGANAEQSGQIAQLRDQLGFTDAQLNQARRTIEELRQANSDQKRTIDSLRQENARLESIHQKERSKLDDAYRNTAVASHNQEAAHVLKDRIRDLEAELEQMNRENVRLFDMVKNTSSVPPPRIPDNMNFDPSKPMVDVLNQQVEKLHLEIKHLKEELSKAYSGSSPDMEALRFDNRRIRSEYIAQIKELENRAVIAEERAKTLLEQYKQALVPNLDQTATRVSRHDYETSKLLATAYDFSKPIEVGGYKGYPSVGEYRSSSNSRRPSYYEPRGAREPSNIFYEEPVLISRHIERERSPFYSTEPVRLVARSRSRSPGEGHLVNRPSMAMQPPQVITLDPIYQRRRSLTPPTRERPSSPMVVQTGPSDLAYKTQNLPDALQGSQSTYASTSRSHMGHTGRPRTRLADMPGIARVSYGDQYLDRISSLYSSEMASDYALRDRGDHRRRAVAEAANTRARQGESFLQDFNRKLSGINSWQ